MTGVVDGIGSAVLKEICNDIKSIYRSCKTFEDILSLLERDLDSLLAFKDDHEKEVQRQRYDKEPTKIYETWKKHVSDIDEELKKLIANQKKRPPRFWNYMSPFNPADKLILKHAQVRKLIEDQKEMITLVDKPPEHVLQFNAPKIMGYPTLQNVLKMILRYLKNERMKAIGLHGMKGVGKTTILKNLNNNEEVSKLFDMVIFISMSDCHNDQKLQEAIAKRLKLDPTNEVARRIQEELRNKKFLLILDGVVDVLDLQQLGISNNDNGSKVVIASQFPEVCSMYDIDPLIEVKRLQPEEALRMFRDVVGSKINSPGIPRIAQSVCKKCSNLPLVIHKIASSFKLKGDAPRWRAALEDLDKQLRNRPYDVLEDLHSFLTFCYEQLEDEQQKCFLYTSLYPAESKVYIDYLVECWAAQGFLGDVDETRRYQRARDSGHKIIGELINVSLLEKGEHMTYVTMNSCMRQLALHILSMHPQYSSYVQNNEEESKESPKSKTWLDVKWVSVMDAKLQNLPTSQGCGVLEILLLQKNSELATIPQTFFENMSNLLVLDLYSTGIKELPSSISMSTNLKALYLNSCKQLSTLPSQMELLQHLEVLDIRGSKVKFIPACIGFLANLRCLRLPYRKNSSQSDHQDVISSKLQKLEELVIEVISYEEWCNQAKNVMKQLALLKCLTTLNCSFPSSSILMRSLTEREESVNHPQIGENDNVEMGEVLLENDKNITKLSNLGIENLNNTIEDCILPNLEQLYLRNLHELEYVFREFRSPETFCQLHTLELENCSNLKSIFSIFPNLEKLYLKNIPDLKCVFIGPLSLRSFFKLQILALEGCKSLESIFSNGAIQNFSRLQKLKVQDCSNIEELIVVTKDIESGRDGLPILEKLELAKLPNLKFICKTKMLAWSSLEALEIYRCPNLKSLPFQKDKAAKLKCIKGEQEWWNQLEETNLEVHQQFVDIFVATCG